MTGGGTKQTSAPKLPVFGSVVEAYREVFKSPARLFTASALPLGIMAALWVILLWRTSLSFWSYQVLHLIEVLAFLLFGLLWFRFLFEDSSVKLLPRPLLGQGSLAYFGYGLLFYFLIWLPVFFLALPLGVSALEQGRAGVPLLSWDVGALLLFLPAALLLWLFFLARFSLVCPAAATRREMSPLGSWRATAGNGLNLFVAYALASLPAIVALFSLLTLGLSRGLFAAGPSGSRSSADILAQGAFSLNFALAQLITVALVISVTAVAYRRLTGNGGPREAASERFE